MNKLAFASIVLTCTASPAFAQGITGLYNTGVSDNGTVLAQGSNDPHWSVDGLTPVTYNNAAYVQSPGASYISKNADGTGGGGFYALTFFVSGSDFSNATISGDFAYDNTVTAAINGRTFYTDDTAAPGSFSAFQTLHHFSLSNAGLDNDEGTLFLTPGYNTLSFAVGDYQAPSALLVTNLVGSTGAVPEPATWAMMLTGFGMIGFGLRSRRKVATTVSFA